MTTTTAITIIPFEDQYANEFRNINVAWLEKYNLMESHDMVVLDDPRGTIIDGGGCIYLAMDGNKVVGSAALMKEHEEGVYELAKMTVVNNYQGRGISKMLLQQCLDAAKDLKATRLTLFSNHQLQTALKLYEQFGFHHIPVEDSPFATADVKMELVL